MNKLIIENRTDISMAEVLTYINAVLRGGRCSNNDTQYCYHTRFDDSVAVTSVLNKKSDRLIVTQGDKE